MAVTAHATGTHTSDGTETEVSSVTSAGVYTFHADLNDMVEGDTVELRIYQIVLTGGTPRVAYYRRYHDVQPADGKIAISVPIANELTDTDSLRFTIKGTTTSGTVSVPWKVLKY